MKLPLKVWFHARTMRLLRERAAAHDLSLSAYVDAAVAGYRPGGAPGQPAATADDWWDTLPPARRAQIHGWVANRRDAPDPCTEPLPMIFEGEPA